MSGNRKYKDSVFTKLFNDERRLIELYNALSKKNLPYDTEVEINTLSDVLFMDRINDISFTIGGNLIVLIEHQSTINENMPLRFLLYIARLYEKILDNDNIYRKKLIKIPTPEFVVLYNGVGSYPDEKTLILSDAFKEFAFKPELELAVKVLNVNMGHNEEIKEESKSLKDYVEFTSMIRKNLSRGLALEEAMFEAIDYCINNGVLKGFLEENSSEVRNMLLAEFDMDIALRIEREEGFQEGETRGETRGKVLAFREVGLSDSEICERLQLSEEQLHEITKQIHS